MRVAAIDTINLNYFKKHPFPLLDIQRLLLFQARNNFLYSLIKYLQFLVVISNSCFFNIDSIILIQSMEEVVSFCLKCNLALGESTTEGKVLLVKESFVKKPKDRIVNESWTCALKTSRNRKDVVLGL